MVLKFNTPDVVFNDPSSDDAAVPALEEGEEDLSEDGSEDESEDDLSGEEISDVDEEAGKPSEKVPLLYILFALLYFNYDDSFLDCQSVL